MATELIIRHRCDLCQEIEDLGEGLKSTVKTYSFNLFGDEFEMELCPSCRGERIYKEPITTIIEKARRINERSRRRERTRQRRIETSADMIYVNRSPDGKWRCPDCGNIYLAQSGANFHFQSAHPEANYRATSRQTTRQKKSRTSGAYPEEMRTCPTCGLVTDNRQKLANHVRHKHNTTLTAMGVALSRTEKSVSA